jgi:hypothetical protein
MEGSHFWEADSLSARKESPCMLWNPKFQDCVHKILPLVHILSQMNPLHTVWGIRKPYNNNENYTNIEKVNIHFLQYLSQIDIQEWGINYFNIDTFCARQNHILRWDIITGRCFV